MEENKKRSVGRPKGTKNKKGVVTGRPKGSTKGQRNHVFHIKLSDIENKKISELMLQPEFKGISKRVVLLKLIESYLNLK